MGAQVLAWDRLYENKKGTTNYNSPLTEYKCLQQACRMPTPNQTIHKLQMFSGSDNLPVNIAASSQTYKKFKETLHEHLIVCLFAVNLWKTWE